MSKIWLPNETKNTCSKLLLDHCYAFGWLLWPSGLNKFFEEGDTRDLFWPHPGTAPGWIWSKNNNPCEGPWILHPYQVSLKSIKRFWRRSWKCKFSNGQTDDGRTTDAGQRVIIIGAFGSCAPKTVSFVICWWYNTNIRTSYWNAKNAWCFDAYCTRWKLSVNLDKTKVVIFEKRKCRRNVIFKMKGEEINQVDSDTYLIIIVVSFLLGRSSWHKLTRHYLP